MDGKHEVEIDQSYLERRGDVVNIIVDQKVFRFFTALMSKLDSD
jgi:hypothetical protein